MKDKCKMRKTSSKQSYAQILKKKKKLRTKKAKESQKEIKTKWKMESIKSITSGRLTLPLGK